MIHLRRLKINKFRTVQPTELFFGEGHNFVLGRNGSGKTSLLNLIVQLLRGDMRPFLESGEELDIELELRGPYADARARSYENEGTLALKYEVRDTFRLRVEAVGDEETAGPLTRRMQLSVHAEVYRRIRTEQTTLPEGVASAIPDELCGRFEGSTAGGAQVSLGTVRRDVPANALESSTFAAQVFVVVHHEIGGCLPSTNGRLVNFALQRVLIAGSGFQHGQRGRFDEALGYYNAILMGQTPEHDWSWPEAPVFIWRRGSVNSRSALPQRVFEAISDELSGNPDARTFDVAHAEPLEQLARALGAERIVIRPDADSGTRDSITFSGFNFDFYWPDGVFHSAKGLSFGQKRLLAFLWYAATLGQSPAITDELTNGLHVDWVYRCIEAIGDRQAFHAVQNPLLVDRAGAAETPEQLAQSFVFCSTSFEGGERRWTWRNPTADEAEMLDSALGSGIQLLSEILMNRGLW